MKIKKWIASLLAVCALAAVFSGCSNPSSTPSGSSSSTSSEGQSGTAEDENVIRVATAGSYPMFTQLKEDGETLEGIDIEVWEEIGRRTGKEIVFVVENLDAAFGDIDAGRVDSAAKQISITPTRQEKYNFSEPYFFSPYRMVVQESNNEITKFEDLYGKKIALETVSAAHEYIKALDPEGKIEILTFPSDLTMLQEVEAGRVDAAPYAEPVLDYAMKQSGLHLKPIGDPIYTEVNAFPFAKTERGDRIRAEVDKALAEMKADGTLSEICIKWCGFDPMLSDAAKEYEASQAK
ncbi:transporter substrate-binding domain-containing protein [Merdimmobilis hominis]|uniref:Putative amino-acid-binding protein YxeM n=1 Tax=uncultured Anaerotruncus sp. TaxID=905011 RepID=A0A6N2TG14_9FIRM|nr:transporter substrate-binding domain-containing protein [Merdimmobilis hominis]MCD4835852.1 transporter substrate-binding domain-containing protein [Merdimmobilis hominis]